MQDLINDYTPVNSDRFKLPPQDTGRGQLAAALRSLHTAHLPRLCVLEPKQRFPLPANRAHLLFLC